MSDGLPWLPEALATGHPCDEACRAEVAKGAVVRLFDNTGDAAWLVRLYSLRVEHLRGIKARFTGADVSDRLAASGHTRVRVACVDGEAYFIVFLAPDDAVVVATIGVDSALANPDFTDW